MDDRTSKQRKAAQAKRKARQRKRSSDGERVRGEERLRRSSDRWRNRFVISAFSCIAVVMAAVLGVTFAVRSGDEAPDDSVDVAEQPSADVREGEEPLAVDVSVDDLSVFMPAESASLLIARAEEDERAAFVVEHAQDYARFGDEACRKLLVLAAEEPEALPFVAGVLDQYPSTNTVSIDEPVEAGTVPRYYQWDVKWAYLDYSSAPLGLSGCCPTSLSMVYAALTGKTDRSPADMAELAISEGYVDPTEGTFAEFLTASAAELGLACTVIPVERYALESRLDAGDLVVCNVGPGDFTDGGHFFVITGMDENGMVTINDPFSEENSDTAWDVDRILSQTMGFYSFSLA